MVSYPLVFLLLVGAADAADPTVGVGLGLVVDLPDAASANHTRFAPGPSLSIPVTLPLTSLVAMRISPRGEVAFGRDRVSWTQSIGGRQYTLVDDDHFSMTARAGVTLGPEVVLAETAISPSLFATIGPSWVGTYHAFEGPTAGLLAPAENDLSDPGNVDPFTSQAALTTEAGLGLRGQGSVGWWAEVGYGSTWVGERALRKSVKSLEAHRAAYGWNPLRLGVGVFVSL